MTYPLSQTEVSGFPSDDLNSNNSLHDAFFEESRSYSDYHDFGDPLAFPLSTDLSNNYEFDELAYGLVTGLEPKQASERDGLRLKLRMSNSVSLGPGSAGSSPSEKNEDSEIMNVEEFLNLPSNDDFVTMEESKQVAPSPAYSLSSGSMDPSPLHTSFSPPHSTFQPKPYTPANKENYLTGKKGKREKTGDLAKKNTNDLARKNRTESSSGYRARAEYGGKSYGGKKRVEYNSKIGDDASEPVIVPPTVDFVDVDPVERSPAKRRISSVVSPVRKTVRKAASQVCKVTPVERRDIPSSETKTPPEAMSPSESDTVGKPGSQKNVLKKYYEQAESLMKTREQEVMELEKKESVVKQKQGVVIGSMERGPRMFGVRYGPCDRPDLGDEGVIASSKPYDVASKYKGKNIPVTIPDEPNTSTSGSNSTEQQFVMNQQLKMSANSKSPKPPLRFLKAHHISPDQSPARRPTLPFGGTLPKNWTSPIPKGKIDLPPFRADKAITKCKRKPDKSVVDLLYQKHLYCSVEKPLFESDPEILKISEAYQLLLNTYVTLGAQRTSALKDLDTLENLRASASARPYKFIKQLKKGDVVFPRRQKVARLPDVKLTHREKEIDINAFKSSSGHAVKKHSDEFANTTRLKNSQRRY